MTEFAFYLAIPIVITAVLFLFALVPEIPCFLLYMVDKFEQSARAVIEKFKEKNK